MLKSNLKNKKIAGSKGAISVIVALAVLAIILTIGLSASSSISGELALSGDSSDSTKAYYAAETGLEEAMYKVVRDETIPLAAKCGGVPPWQSFPPAQYCLVLTPASPASYLLITAIKSIGEYGSVRRSVEIGF